jgi:hypothetical protein
MSPRDDVTIIVLDSGLVVTAIARKHGVQEAAQPEKTGTGFMVSFALAHNKYSYLDDQRRRDTLKRGVVSSAPAGLVPRGRVLANHEGGP